MKPLIITEKPSVATEIAKVLGNFKKHNGYMESPDYVITWAVGHLITLKEPKEQNPAWETYDMELLPMFPEKMQYKVIPGVKEQFQIIKKLINRNDVSYLINAGDDGREGEYIQRLIYEFAGNQKPMKRLCIDSVTTKTIQTGFQNLKDGHVYDGYYEAGKGRAWSDWLIGMNFSRMVGLTYHAKGVHIGRVQTPTLGMIGQRCADIENFKSVPFFQVVGTFQEGFSATWIDEANENAIKEKEKADLIKQKCSGQQGSIISLETKPKILNRPKLYSLNSLQADANKKYKYTIDEVLTIAQSLYEKHKITTYPRTESEYITEDLSEEMLARIREISALEEYREVGQAILENGLNLDKNVVNNEKVTDHHAIIINENFATFNRSLLSEKEANVLDLILKRMLLAVAAVHQYEETTMIVEVEGERFRTIGKMITVAGWKQYEAILNKSKRTGDTPPSDGLEVFDKLQAGQTVVLEKAEIFEKKTTPPKYFTEGELVKAMENISRIIEDKDLKEVMKKRGLGTTATRASIIEGLLKVGYIERKKNSVHITELGKNILAAAPVELRTPEMSAEWEIKLQAIEKGQGSLDEFMQEIQSYIQRTVQQYRSMTIESNPLQNLSETTVIVGKCPYCGGQVRETKKGFICENTHFTEKGIDEKGCAFFMSKNHPYFAAYGIRLTQSMIKSLLLKGEVIVKGIQSKKGTKYSMIFHVKFKEKDNTGNYPRPEFSAEFFNAKKKSFGKFRYFN